MPALPERPTWVPDGWLWSPYEHGGWVWELATVDERRDVCAARPVGDALLKVEIRDHQVGRVELYVLPTAEDVLAAVERGQAFLRRDEVVAPLSEIVRARRLLAEVGRILDAARTAETGLPTRRGR